MAGHFNFGFGHPGDAPSTAAIAEYFVAAFCPSLNT